MSSQSPKACQRSRLLRCAGCHEGSRRACKRVSTYVTLRYAAYDHMWHLQHCAYICLTNFSRFVQPGEHWGNQAAKDIKVKFLTSQFEAPNAT